MPESSHSAWNPEEVEAVVALVDGWAASGLLGRKDLGFGVVTPFRLQAEKIRDALRRRPWGKGMVEVAVGTAHLFQGNERDVMVFSPVVSEGMRSRLVRWVVETEPLLNVAVTRARAALHVVGDRAACRRAGGFLAELAADASGGGAVRRAEFESAAEERMADFLDRAGLWYINQHPFGRYRLDVFLVSPLGRRIDLEVDGRGHRSDEGGRSDEVRDAALRAAGIEVIRIPARTVFERPEAVLTFLRRLV